MMQSPGVRRLCVAVDAPRLGLLGGACQAGGFGRLYTECIRTEGLELGFASPGVDEAVLVTDLIAALRGTAAEARAASASPHYLALAAFHVGITRVEGDDLRGAAVARIRQMVRELAPAAAVDAGPEAMLAVAISSNLFDDIGAECGFTDGWIHLATARAWYRGYGEDRSALPHGIRMEDFRMEGSERDVI